MSSVDYFRVVDLGQDLLEYLTLYFNRKEGHPLLFVSTGFHDVFARSVWHVIKRKTIDMAEPTRSAAFARYGRLVRSIDLRMRMLREFETLNWSELFPNATRFGFDVCEWMDSECKKSFFDAIAAFHGLHAVAVFIGVNQPPFDLDGLAKALIKRNQDRSKKPVRRLEFILADRFYNESWHAAYRFVKDVEPLNMIKLRVCMRSGVGSPTPAQFAALRLYLVEINDRGLYNDTDDCYALANRNLFSPSGSAVEPLVFPQLHRFGFCTCCTSPDICDYSDFTPVKFPSLYSLTLHARPCPNRTDGNEMEVAKRIILQQWPKLEHLTLGQPIDNDFLERIFEYHPKLYLFNTRLPREMFDDSGVFKIERILESLPQLNNFSLAGPRETTFDIDWAITDYSMERIAVSKLKLLELMSAQLSIRLLGFLLRLPKLVDLRLWSCVFADIDVAIGVLKQAQTGDGHEYQCSIKDMFLVISGVEESWPSNLVLELVAAMPRLRMIHLHAPDIAAIVEAVRERFPRLTVES
ncbi:hypothetical protein GQ42DRAFT_164979 [Ramicandelaber brevisporus]|nr:hypothetical protein GQ42DRAFT_164979 [Ramicandelaber brevisporus]